MSVTIRRSRDTESAVRRAVPLLVADRVATRLCAQDATLWGAATGATARISLGWTPAVAAARPLIPEILALRDELAAAGISHIVLGGMGGSALASEMIARTAGVELTVPDTTDPDRVHAALHDRLSSTALVICSKSGETIETDSQLRAYEKAFVDAGIDPRGRIIVVTDPGTPLEGSARRAGYRVFLTDPRVSGRYSALTAIGLVPAGLAGADIQQLLDEAEAITPDLAVDAIENPGFILGAAIAATNPLRDKLGFVLAGTRAVGFDLWAEQLITESIGKRAGGLFPFTLAPNAPELDAREAMHLPDLQIVRLVDDADCYEDSRPGDIIVSGSLGGLVLLWEYASVVAGRILGINPFAQPDIDASDMATRALVRMGSQPVPPALTSERIEVRGSADIVNDSHTLKEAVDSLLSFLGDDGYVAVQVYADRLAFPQLEDLRDSLATKARRPVTLGWGPRFLHSTGLYQEGGSAKGVFLQITTTGSTDLFIPGRPFTFEQLLAAQAAGDTQDLLDQGLPVITLTLPTPETNLTHLMAALG